MFERKLLIWDLISFLCIECVFFYIYFDKMMYLLFWNECFMKLIFLKFGKFYILNYFKLDVVFFNF